MASARSFGMSTMHEPEIERETEVIERPNDHHVDHIERVERVTERPAYVPAGQVNVNAGAYGAVWTLTRVVTLVFTVLEVLLLARFALKLLAANPNQPLVAGLYAATEPLVRPFQGIFPQANAPVVVDLAALLAIVFLFLVVALIVALVRAIAGRTA